MEKNQVFFLTNQNNDRKLHFLVSLFNLLNDNFIDQDGQKKINILENLKKLRFIFFGNKIITESTFK